MNLPLEKTVVQALLARGGRQTGQEIVFRCPFPNQHKRGDARPSCSYNLNKRAWICHGCGARGNLRRLANALGVAVPQVSLIREKRYLLEDANGQLIAEHIRRDLSDGTKRFSWRRPGHVREGLHNLRMKDLPLYRLGALLKTALSVPVVLTEGERKCDALQNLVGSEAVVVAVACGAGTTPSPSVLRPLVGRKVYLWPDHDDPGRVLMNRIASKLQRLGVSAKIIHWPGAREPGDDAGDFVERGGTLEEFRQLLASAGAPSTTSETADRTEGSGDDASKARVHDYEMDFDGICRLKIAKDENGERGIERDPVTNFSARIVSEVIEDDGSEDVRRLFEVETQVGDRKQNILIPAKDFDKMSWVSDRLGARAVVYPHKEAHARTAIKLFSKDAVSRTVFAHLGWRKQGDQMVYLHAAGAICASGEASGVEVRVDDPLSRFVLPPTPTGPDLTQAVRTSLRVLDLAPLRITVPLLGAVYRAPLGGVDWALHLEGESGALKSELAAIAQQHYGAMMHRQNLPVSWSSTANAIEGVLFGAKDALVVVDDLVLEGSLAEIARRTTEAARVFRAVGNSAARQRMRSDATLRPPKPPRCLVVSTGETTPRGRSVNARMYTVVVAAKDVDLSTLTCLQEMAEKGVLASALGAYVQWLAAHPERLHNAAKTDIECSKEFSDLGTHRRTPRIAGALLTGFKTYLDFAAEIGAMNPEEKAGLLRRARAALRDGISDQGAIQAEDDPARLFLDSLRAGIVSKRAHVANACGTMEPPNPSSWGWTLRDDGRWVAGGSLVGWLDGNDLYLDPTASHAAAAQFARDTGAGLGGSPQTIRRRLSERGLLASTGEAEGRRTTLVRRTIGGIRRHVLHIPASLLFEAPGSPEKSEPPIIVENCDQTDQNELIRSATRGSGGQQLVSSAVLKTDQIADQLQVVVDRPATGCPACHSTRFWVSKVNPQTPICATCHPPADEALVKEFLEA